MFLIILSPIFPLIDHHKGHHHDHKHDSAVTSVSIVSEGTLDLDYVRASLLAQILFNTSIFRKMLYIDHHPTPTPSCNNIWILILLIFVGVIQFDDWLERLIEEKGDDLYRMKGILSVTDSEQRYVFQVIFISLESFLSVEHFFIQDMLSC